MVRSRSTNQLINIDIARQIVARANGDKYFSAPQQAQLYSQANYYLLMALLDEETV